MIKIKVIILILLLVPLSVMAQQINEIHNPPLARESFRVLVKLSLLSDFSK